VSTDNTPDLTIKTHADLLHAVPYLLGYSPTESLVVIGVDTGVTIAVRIDVDQIGNDRALRNLCWMLRRASSTGLVALLYTEMQPHPTLADIRIAEPAAEAHLELIDTMLVSGDRWWSLENPTRCPHGGYPVPSIPTAVDAAAVYSGMIALPSVQAIAEVLAPLPNQPDLAAGLEQFRQSAVLDGTSPDWDRSAIQALFEAADEAAAGRFPSDEQAARFGMALQSYVVRDALWLAVDDERVAGLQLWINLARRLPGRYAGAPLFFVAWRSWRDGDGPLAKVAAEMALTTDPMCSAAEIVLDAITAGIDPRTLPALQQVTAPQRTGSEVEDIVH
jgi:hypothetical protein